MNSELTKAAQQALEEAHMLILPVPSPEVSALDLAKSVSERATKIATLLTSALSQRPAAQTEREAFLLWWAGTGMTLFQDTAFAAWQARASLPAPQQATPERHLTVTTNQQGEAVMVSWQDDEHRILEVVWERKQATPEPVGEQLQGGLDNDALLNAWLSKLPGVTPTDAEMTAFALGVEVGFAHARTLERSDWSRVHEALQAAGVHPGRTDDHLADVIAKALANRPAPVEAEPVGEPDTVPLDALHAAERERDYWKTRARAMLDHAEGTCWYWMGDGEDHLESLVSSLPVVIRADQLRELLARPAPSVPEGWRITPTHDGIDVHTPNGTSVYVEPKALGDRKLLEEVLHALCSDLLAAAQAKGGEQ